MVGRLTHGKKGDPVNRSMPALGGAFALTGVASGLRSAFRLTVPDGIPYSLSGQSASLTLDADWSVGSPSMVEGTSDTYALTGPTGYTAGGTYDVDVSGADLPSGMSLSDDGTLSVGFAADGVTSGVIFGYNEPGALPVLTLHGTATNVPYMATLYPAEGAVPSGMSVESTDDTNLRGVVLSTWEDGSAQVMVVAGQTTVSGTKALTLRPVVTPSDALMSTTQLAAAVVGDITVNFGGGVQTLTNAQLVTNYDRIWWRNSQVICARYRLSCGLGVMEAVIDVHAFAGGLAFVEVVIENGKMSSSSPSRPATQTYTSATVSVNGSTIATVSSPTAGQSYGLGTYSGGHEAFRSWYCSGWIGGDPGIAVTHDTASLQAHPMFYRCARAASYNFASQTFSAFGGVTQTYGADTYVPWRVGRHRAPYMGGAGDDYTIGPFTAWESRYIQSGDRYVRNAVIENAKCLLSFNVNYRDSATNSVTDPDSVTARFSYSTTGAQADNWPYTATEPAWEIAHQPEVGLVAFLCRPSPCFLELAQKVALWNCTYYPNSNIYFQTRGRAWGMRNLGHGIFVTPDALAWKTGGRNAYARNVTNITNGFKNIATNPLNLVVDSESTSVSSFQDHRSAVGFQQSIWQHHFVAGVLHRHSQGKILRGASQTALDALADWACEQPIRWVNEQTNGGWRFHRYETTIGTINYGNQVSGSPMGQLSDWGSMQDWWMSDDPASVSGPWKVTDAGDDSADRSYASSTFQTQPAAAFGLNYVEHFWTAFCMGVERGVTGADTAWDTVNANVTGLSTWLDGFANDARQGMYPRNK